MAMPNPSVLEIPKQPIATRQTAQRGEKTMPQTSAEVQGINGQTMVDENPKIELMTACIIHEGITQMIMVSNGRMPRPTAKQRPRQQQHDNNNCGVPSEMSTRRSAEADAFHDTKWILTG